METNEIKILVLKFLKNKSISVSLINKYSDKGFLMLLYSKADLVVLNTIRSGVSNEFQKGLIAVAITAISMFEYKNDVWTNIETIFQNSYRENSSMARSIISDALAYFKPRFKYPIKSSLIAVPLISAGIPHGWINKFYDFCYDLYKVNLNASRSINSYVLENEIRKTFIALKDENLLDDINDESFLIFRRKTYKLSKFTQSALKTGINLDGVTKIAEYCVSTIIDTINSENNNKINPFFEEGYHEWLGKNKVEVNKIRNTDNPGGWSACFRYCNGKVFLCTKNESLGININPQEYVLRIYENDRLYKQIDNINYHETFGGYLIQSMLIELNCNVLNNVSYKLCNIEDGSCLYDSKDSLYKDKGILIFDERGQQTIQNGKDYIGNAILFTLKPVERGNILHIYNGCIVSNIDIRKNSSYIFDDKVFIFRKLKNQGVYGSQIENLTIESRFNNKTIKVFKFVNKLVYKSKYKLEDLVLFRDQKRFDFELIESSKIDENQYEINFKLDNFSDGFHEITIYYKNGKSSLDLLSTFDFVIDSDFNYEILQLEENALVEINSSFGYFSEQLVDGQCDLKADVDIPGLGSVNYIFFANIVYISINNKYWLNNSNELYYKNISIGSPFLYYKGDSSYFIKLKNCDKEIPLTSVSFDENNHIRKIDISSIFTIARNKNGFINLIFKNDEMSFTFKINFQIRVRFAKGYPSYNYEKGECDFKFDFEKHNSTTLKLFDSNKKLMFNKDISPNEVISIGKIIPFVDYKVVIYEKENVSLIKKDQEIFHNNFLLEDINYSIGESFDIVCYLIQDRNLNERVVNNYNSNIFIHIICSLGEFKYKIAVYEKNETGFKLLKHLIIKSFENFENKKLWVDLYKNDGNYVEWLNNTHSMALFNKENNNNLDKIIQIQIRHRSMKRR